MSKITIADLVNRVPEEERNDRSEYAKLVCRKQGGKPETVKYLGVQRSPSGDETCVWEVEKEE